MVIDTVVVVMIEDRSEILLDRSISKELGIGHADARRSRMSKDNKRISEFYGARSLLCLGPDRAIGVLW